MASKVGEARVLEVWNPARHVAADGRRVLLHVLAEDAELRHDHAREAVRRLYSAGKLAFRGTTTEEADAAGVAPEIDDEPAENERAVYERRIAETRQRKLRMLARGAPSAVDGSRSYWEIESRLELEVKKGC